VEQAKLFLKYARENDVFKPQQEINGEEEDIEDEKEEENAPYRGAAHHQQKGLQGCSVRPGPPGGTPSDLEVFHNTTDVEEEVAAQVWLSEDTDEEEFKGEDEEEVEEDAPYCGVATSCHWSYMDTDTACHRIHHVALRIRRTSRST